MLLRRTVRSIASSESAVLSYIPHNLRKSFAATMTTASGQSLSPSPPNASSHKTVNAWQQPGPSAFDFRSDTITTPNASMLNAIINTTLMDDVFCEDPTTNALESSIAKLTSHEAALLVMSGTMGNQISIRTHLARPPYSVLADSRAHIIKHEAGGPSTMSGAMLIPVFPSNLRYLTLEDIKANVVIDDDVHACPTKVISLENTLHGMIMPLSEVSRIAAFARENDIRLHLDGARLWEVSAATATPISEFTRHFDSVSLCFSKGLGAPIGSMIVGSVAFIKHARRVRKTMGGGTRQSGIISAAARVAVEEGLGTKADGSDGKLRTTHLRAARIGKRWEDLGGSLGHPVETNMVWLDLPELGGHAPEKFVELGREEGLKLLPGGRLVVHYQIAEEAEEKLMRLLEKLASMRESRVTNGDNGDHKSTKSQTGSGFRYQ